MKEEGAYFSTGGGAIGGKVYNSVIRALRDVWETVFEEPLEVTGQWPSDRFASVVRQLEVKLQNQNARVNFAKALDVDPSDAGAMIDELIEQERDPQTISSVDDLTPNEIFAAFWDIAYEVSDASGPVDISLASFLRKSLDRIFEARALKGRLNVGANRHLPRLIQWVRELEENTYGDGGRGFRLRNSSGKGKVRSHPTDPGTLKITIDQRFF